MTVSKNPETAEALSLLNSPGERICFLRKQAKMTQRQLADLIGINAVAVTLWEQNKNLPNKENADRMCALLKSNWSWIRTGQGDPFDTISTVSLSHNIPCIPVELIGQSNKDPQSFLTDNNFPARNYPPASKADFCFQVDTAEMAPTINPGDIVFVQEKSTLDACDSTAISIVRTQSGVFAGRIKKTPSGRRVCFDNESPAYSPITFDESSLVGIVVDLIPHWLVARN